MANRGGFSWKRVLGVTRQKQRFSRATGIPLTKSGRQRKIGKALTGGGCLLWILLLLAIVVFLGAFASAALAFTDVPAGHAYGSAIEDLSARGIINGFPDGTFGPGKPVTRQQFAKMIVLTMALGVTEADVCPFGDVQVGGYADPFYPDNYIAVCATNEITKGTSPSTFAPGDPIKRAQLLTMVVRAADRLDPGSLGAPPAGYSGSLPSFDDPTHSPNMRKAEYNGLLGGLQGFGAAWDPWAPSTRGEVAQVLHNLLEPPAGPPLEIVSIHADAAGNDNDNLNDEYVVFRTLASGTLAGYAVEDAASHRYEFPDRVFTAGQTFKLHTGSGSNTQTDLYWGNGSAIWNNDGDTIKVLDNEGHVLLSQSY